MRILLVVILIITISCNSNNSQILEEKQSINSKQDSLGLNSQTQLSDYDGKGLVLDSEFFNYSTINGHIFKKKRAKALWDDKVIPLDIHYGLVFQNQKVYVCSNEDTIYSFYQIDNSGKLIKKGFIEADFLYVTFNNFYCVKNKILYKINPENQQFMQIFDFKDKTSIKEGIENKICGINELSNDYIQVELCRYNSGCYDFDSYIICLTDNTLRYDNDFKKHERDNDMMKTCFFLVDNLSEQFFAYFYSSKKYSTDNGYILNRDFQIIDTIPNKDDKVSFQCAYCEYGTYIAGLNVVNNVIKNYYIGTHYYEINQSFEYFLPYVFNPSLDKILGKIYNNKMLVKQEIEIFNKTELGIIKNFIFAKHNYQFDNEFYRAYFSTFKFYNSEHFINTRTKDVNSKLSEADLYNLNILK